MKTVDLVYFDAGGGHRAAALALQEAIHREGRPWRLRLVHLAKVLDPQDRFRRATGFAPEDVYNKRLARGWTLGLGQELKLLQGMIRLAHGRLVQQLASHWAATEPDLVVSLVPNFNRALGESLRCALPGVPFVTVMTDLVDLPPHFWIEPEAGQHLVCGSGRAEAQARAAGLPPTHIHRVSGMLLHPDFHAPLPLDRAAERRALGLDPERPVGVVMFGGQGSMQMLRIARQLSDEPLILLCGHNAVLAERLRALRGPQPQVVVGYTREVVRWLRLADYFVGKPGPGCLSEALHLGLPVITFRNAWTMPQERPNTDWIRDEGLGLVLRSVDALPDAVRALRSDWDGWRARVARCENRAVFEVSALIERLLARAERPQAVDWIGAVAAARG
ncbi:galactosyldiacylglycerol synthase [Piscinibacter sakaiensis]|uniref:galactosyldiacylglycerol synthase n=1 Tax=Piscinibacter sakaiensis TaxID=1547922 RepID=UPI0006B5B233|nr:galactosyldiacylglycerol synthase [Piscinibacter sakaiensis]